MLEEALKVIRLLWEGDSVTHRGKHFTVEDATIFDLPSELPPIVVSAFAETSAELAAQSGDGLWTTGTKGDVIEAYKSAGGTGPIWSQLSLCWDEDRDKALERAHRMWPNTGLPGQLAQDLRTVEHMEQATRLVKPDDLEGTMPIGPDPEPLIRSINEAEAAGIEYIYMHQIGNPLRGFLDFWVDEIEPEMS
jgi:G6PDH family F420-dependent oxidoreductase